MTEKGKFIVLYGANNLGKSSQVEMLEESLHDRGIKTVTVKYPIYDLKPTGPQIDAVLRKGKKMPELKLQQLYARNRFDFQPQLKAYLKDGTWVIGEDYTGTGVAWGLVRKAPLPELEKMNKGLIKEDLAILLHGERFRSGIEQNHRNETDDEIWTMAQVIHLALAERYGWKTVYASRLPEEVHRDIFRIVKENLLLESAKV